MIQIRQAEYSATVIWLASLFAHDDGLPCRRIGTTKIGWTLQLGGASSWSEGVLSDMACFQQLCFFGCGDVYYVVQEYRLGI
jgi:hypothetical protein